MTILFLILAGFFKAVADTLADHYDTSIFKALNEKWWRKDASWEYAKFLPLTKYRMDAWHLAGSGMIICFSLAIVFHEAILPWYWEFLIAGVVFNLTFNISYNKILR